MMDTIETRLAAILTEIEDNTSPNEERTRLCQGLRYALDQSTKEDALQFLYECQDIASVWCLESFDLENVLEAARERWQDIPELEEIADDAASRVAHKWAGTDGETAGAATDWALDLMEEYAANRGIKLINLEDSETEIEQ